MIHKVQRYFIPIATERSLFLIISLLTSIQPFLVQTLTTFQREKRSYWWIYLKISIIAFTGFRLPVLTVAHPVVRRCIIFSPRIQLAQLEYSQDQYIWSIVIPPSISIVTIRFRTDNRDKFAMRFMITLINLGDKCKSVLIGKGGEMERKETKIYFFWKLEFFEERVNEKFLLRNLI